MFINAFEWVFWALRKFDLERPFYGFCYHMSQYNKMFDMYCWIISFWVLESNEGLHFIVQWLSMGDSVFLIWNRFWLLPVQMEKLADAILKMYKEGSTQVFDTIAGDGDNYIAESLVRFVIIGIAFGPDLMIFGETLCVPMVMINLRNLS